MLGKKKKELNQTKKAKDILAKIDKMRLYFESAKHGKKRLESISVSAQDLKTLGIDSGYIHNGVKLELIK